MYGVRPGYIGISFSISDIVQEGLDFLINSRLNNILYYKTFFKMTSKILLIASEEIHS